MTDSEGLTWPESTRSIDMSGRRHTRAEVHPAKRPKCRWSVVFGRAQALSVAARPILFETGGPTSGRRSPARPLHSFKGTGASDDTRKGSGGQDIA